MNNGVHSGHYDQTKQWISFTSGVDNVAPNPEDYAVHVLSGDTFLYEINGGFPDGPADPFVTDPIVYPSSDYWQTLLEGERMRPFFDISISEYNTLRIPSAVHEYDLYVDSAVFYEDVDIRGNLTMGGSAFGEDINIPGDITCRNIECEEITADVIHDAVLRTRIRIVEITENYTLQASDSATVFQCRPTGANIDITLPTEMPEGFHVTLTNLLPGKTTTLPVTLQARGNILSEPYSSATVYYDGTDWYGFGDLV